MASCNFPRQDCKDIGRYDEGLSEGRFPFFGMTMQVACFHMVGCAPALYSSVNIREIIAGLAWWMCLIRV